VSIVLPTRDRASLLRSTLDSVQRQTWRHLEILVVDDGSTDDTVAMLREAIELDPRIRVFRLDPSQGAAVARNRAIGEARGDYIAFQDDDCLWAPDKVELLVRTLEEHGDEVGFAYHASESLEIDGSRRLLGVRAPEDKHRGPWAAGTFAVMVRRRALMSSGGFDERLPRLQDFDLWVRILAHTDYVYVPRILVHTVRSVGGISTRSDALAEAAALLRAKYGSSSILESQERAHVFHALGHGLLTEGFWWAGVRSFVAAVRSNPRMGRSWMAVGAAALGPRAYRVIAAWREESLGLGGATSTGSDEARSGPASAG
jgi:glycosyltransferase involved in cell wall biosynthesis